MDNWFLEHEHQVTVILIIVLSLLLILFITMLFLSSYKKLHQSSRVKAKKRRCYIFKVDFEKATIVYFERTNPKDQVEVDIESFYQHILSPKDRDIFRKWLEGILTDGSNLLTEITINLDGRQIVPLYFTIDSVNASKKIVHLSSYSVEYLNENVNKHRYLLTPVNESKGVQIGSVFTKKSVNSGFLLFVRFFALDKRLDDTKRVSMSNELKQVCFLYLKERRTRLRIEFDDEYSFVIYDTGASNLAEMQRTVMSLIKMLNSRLEINSYQEVFNFSIGAVETKYFADGKKCIEAARIKSMSAERQYNKVDWFHPGEAVDSIGTEAWEQELDLALKGKKRDRRLRFLYQPLVLYGTSPQMYGYITQVEPENSEFHNIDEMRIKANEYNRSYELLTVICRTLINKFYNEVVKRFIGTNTENNLRLFIPISSYDKDNIVKVLSDVRHAKECRVVIIFDEDDMNDMVARNYEEAIKTLMGIKKRKYELAICLHDSNLTWANGVYEVFDYFMIDKSVTSGKESLDSSSTVKKLSAKLISFHKPMIALDMENKSMIQIMLNRSFTIFGGAAIENASEDIIELTSRKMSIVKK